jgi:hypothetical protein
MRPARRIAAVQAETERTVNDTLFRETPIAFAGHVCVFRFQPKVAIGFRAQHQKRNPYFEIQTHDAFAAKEPRGFSTPRPRAILKHIPSTTPSTCP